jgi:pimeloyl-ACP methyl ester carboxylesterase
MKKGYIDGPEGQVHYWMTGHGPTLLMIHQAAQSSEEYRAIGPVLGKHYQVLAIDLPGHGASDDPPRELEMDDFTRATLALLDALDISHLSILGHHGGSSIAIDIAARQPERVNKVILSGCGIRTPEEVQALLAARTTRNLAIRNDGEFLIDTWKRYVELTGPETTAETTFIPFLESLRARLRPYDAHHAILRWDRKPVLSRMQCAVLLIQGQLDDFVNRQAELLDLIPNSTRHVMPGCGAFMYFEQPAEIAGVIREFLAD